MNKAHAKELLKKFDFKALFLDELGWDNHEGICTLNVGDEKFQLSAVAEKRGMAAFVCPMPDKPIDYPTRGQIEAQLAKSIREHIVIYVDKNKRFQTWQWVKREPGRPIARREHTYAVNQSGEALVQKLEALEVRIEEEAQLTLVGIAGMVQAAFDIERITKAFYREFDAHRKAFSGFIDGISEVADRQWYASVMLNRLMFIYFIQRKGFLDGDTHYLRNRLQRCQQAKGKDKFYSFYRYFLLRLFHEGFGKRRQERAPDLEKLIGNIPYLNGGLFDVHELEKPERYGKSIQIPDKAFERIFAYFDRYQWHLDERPLRADNEINPDVLGYIFEKYINQKQMGAYYTKEDITEYISKNSVIPFLFDAARAKCKVAFDNPNGPTVWDLLRKEPDRYIYDAMKKGVDLPLPKNIAAGLDTQKPNLLDRRKDWNKPAAEEFALPTETWREAIARRQRCEEIRKKLAAGEIREINDFITMNLDLRQFAQDVIQNCEGPDLLMAFWQAITSITILDPTGGSGAFIFAALNILEPLYEACLDRMEAFLAEWGEAGKKLHPNYHKKLTEVLARVDAHPNRRYFVLKSIILNNLYAVDIMEEAVEICKLRLFLKLAAQVEPDATRENLGIEPLPDIDFNIRAGNSLVGFAKLDEVKLLGTLDFDNATEKIAIKAADLQQTFDKFREIQTEGDGSVPAAHKRELQSRLKALEGELNQHLAAQYDISPRDKTAYAKWLAAYQPFHWCIHFYGILSRGGFDVIIGNPPYVEYSKVSQQYRVLHAATLSTNNLYAMVSERTISLINPNGTIGIILPNSSVSAEKMKPLQSIFRNQSVCWISHFAWRPSKLFDGANMLLAIWVIRSSSKEKCLTTKYNRWYREYRDYLFPTLNYHEVSLLLGDFRIPKMPCPLAISVYQKCLNVSKGANLLSAADTGPYNLYYFRAVLYWFKVLIEPPIMEEDGKRTTTGEMKELTFSRKNDRDVSYSLMASNLFALHYVIWSSCQVVNSPDLMFPVNIRILSQQYGNELAAISVRLIRDVQKRSIVQTRQYSARNREYTMRKQYFFFKESKSIINEIDMALARYYGFTEEELDFIINYDIKYRLGQAEEDGDE